VTPGLGKLPQTGPGVTSATGNGTDASPFDWQNNPSFPFADSKLTKEPTWFPQSLHPSYEHEKWCTFYRRSPCAEGSPKIKRFSGDLRNHS
jgi:hypothetical protein